MSLLWKAVETVYTSILLIIMISLAATIYILVEIKEKVEKLGK